MFIDEKEYVAKMFYNVADGDSSYILPAVNFQHLKNELLIQQLVSKSIQPFLAEAKDRSVPVYGKLSLHS